MTEKFDFDTAPDRHSTGSYKWDSCPGEDVIPMWVADMDFATAPAIIDALRRRVEHGVFGYTLVGDRYYDALVSWFSRRHGYTIDRSKVIYTSGVVPAISAIIKALTLDGEGVIVQTPVYNCFFSSIRNNGCRIVENPLVRTPLGADGHFSYAMDLDGLERLAADKRNTLLLLCNPHNPAGRAWTSEEILHVAEICRRNDITVVSDEIHCDLTMPGHKFTSYATLPEEYTSSAIICNSPSKAFNTAGLQIANIIAGNESQHKMIDRAINDNEVCDVNPFGVEGLIAAYTHGEPWLDALTDYLHENYRCLSSFFAENLPELPLARLEATYLVWVDTAACGVTTEALEEILLEKGRVWLNGGNMYGRDGFMRINIACPRSRMMEGLVRMAEVLRPLINEYSKLRQNL